jgi:hypothetical protein
MNINIGLTAPKANADSEKDAVVNPKGFPEDKIMSLLLAFDRRDAKILKFLLDECY